MNLLIDIGNSRIKWQFECADIQQQSQALDYKASDFEGRLLKHWKQNRSNPAQLLISCVANKILLQQVCQIALSLWPEVNIRQVESAANAFNVTNAYSQPEKLGVDRWLALIATHHYYHDIKACIIDCGSAITLDLIDEKGVHQGGLITPGINMMKRSLVNNTAALPMVEDSFPLALAKNTQAAIYCGIMYSVVGMIHAIVKQHGAAVKLILTGGDAALIAQYLDRDYIIDTDLVLKGLRLYAQPLP